MDLSNKEMIEQAVNKMSEKFPSEDKGKYIDLLSRIFEDGEYPQEAMGLNDEFIEMLYAYAYTLFQSGKYDLAANTYKFLMTVCPMDIRHPMALAACFHKMKNYTGALSTYVMCTYLAPSNPMSFYHASDCLIKLNSFTGAIAMLSEVVKLTEGNPEYATLKERAELSIQSLQKQLENPAPRP